MTITLQAVNELIASLESAGELSIREQKFLNLAKAYQQLAAENVALKQFPEQIVQFISGLGTSEIGIDTKEKIGLAAIRIKAPPPIASYPGLRLMGWKNSRRTSAPLQRNGACKEGHSSLLKVAESADLFAKQLREGADK
ncbi:MULTISPECIES: hypothetical protein [Klebsiella pneumoniae complex]|uniref:hypothetical protein n=1 Tax=Klebsiella pneumoniae complex TaxID=3390273 RepID=UPI0015FEDA67|nr:hypothetical protein [Klebsiella variicola]